MKKNNRWLYLPAVLLPALAFAVIIRPDLLVRDSSADVNIVSGEGAFVVVGSWGIFRGNEGLTGFLDGGFPGKFSLAWTADCGAGVQSSPVVFGKRLYISTIDGLLLCLSSVDGSKVWQCKSEDGFEASPLVFSEKIYCGTSEGDMQAHSGTDGKLLWRFSANGKISGSANAFMHNGKEYVSFGSYDNNLYCLDGTDGKLLWNFRTDNYINGTPAFGDGKLVFGGCDSRLRIIALDSGSELASIDVGSYIPGSPAFSGGYVYAAQYTGDIIKVEVVGGKIVWKFSAGEKGQFFGVPAVGEGVVVASAKNGMVFALSLVDGRKLWQSRADGGCLPVIIDGKVLLAGGEGKISLLRLLSGENVWSYELGEGIAGSPAVTPSGFYVVSVEGRVYYFSGK